MAKKSKRPPARKQQLRRPQTSLPQPRTTTAAEPLADLAPATDEAQDDYAATALPYSESDGPMPLPPPAPAVPAEPAAAAPADATYRRRVGRIDPSAAAQRAAQAQRPKGRAQSTAAMFEPLPPDDAAIPFDRVPYVPGDLRRVLIIAGLMVVLIVVANFVINAVVK